MVHFSARRLLRPGQVSVTQVAPSQVDHKSLNRRTQEVKPTSFKVTTCTQLRWLKEATGLEQLPSNR